MLRKVFGWSIFFFLPSIALAANPQLEKITSPPPEAVSAGIRELLNSEGFRVLDGSNILGEFWLRKDVPLSESPSGELGVAFGKLQPGTLLGVAHFPNGWSDYKGKPVKGGVYTLRYGVQPADGNHLGASLYRDFLLLNLTSDDADAKVVYSMNELVTLSKKASGTAHPAVLSLFPVNKEVAAPQLTKNELDQWMVEAKAGSISFGLVVTGHGEV